MIKLQVGILYIPSAGSLEKLVSFSPSHSVHYTMNKDLNKLFFVTMLLQIKIMVVLHFSLCKWSYRGRACCRQQKYIQKMVTWDNIFYIHWRQYKKRKKNEVLVVGNKDMIRKIYMLRNKKTNETKLWQTFFYPYAHVYTFYVLWQWVYFMMHPTPFLGTNVLITQSG